MSTREKLEAKMNEPPKPALEVVRLYLRGIADIDKDDEIQRGLDLQARHAVRAVRLARGRGRHAVLRRLVAWRPGR